MTPIVVLTVGIVISLVTTVAGVWLIISGLREQIRSTYGPDSDDDWNPSDIS